MELGVPSLHVHTPPVFWVNGQNPSQNLPTFMTNECRASPLILAPCVCPGATFQSRYFQKRYCTCLYHKGFLNGQPSNLKTLHSFPVWLLFRQKFNLACGYCKIIVTEAWAKTGILIHRYILCSLVWLQLYTRILFWKDRNELVFYDMIVMARKLLHLWYWMEPISVETELGLQEW